MKNKNGKEYIILVLFATMYGITVSVLCGIGFLTSIVSSILLFFAFYKNLSNYKNKNLFIVFLFIFLAHLVLIMYNSVHRDLPFTNVDWRNFDVYAKTAIYKSTGFFDVYSNSVDLFSAIVAYLYMIFEVNITIIYFFILPLAYLSSDILHKILLKMNLSKKHAEFFSLILLLYPVNFIFSISVLREIPIQFLTLFSFYHFLNYLHDNNKKVNLVFAIVLILLACMMHSGMIGVFISYLYVIFQNMIYASKRVKFFRPSVIVITLLILLLLSTTSIWGNISSRFRGLANTNDVVSTMNFQNDYLEANTQYVTEVPDSFMGIVLTIPYRYIMFTLSPFPWQIYNFQTLISLILDGLLRYIIVYNIIMILKNINKYDFDSKKIIIILIIMIVATNLIFCLGVSNYGAAMRHRTKILPLELLLIALGRENKQLWKKKKYQ